jgi:hypothetical protein
MKLRKRNGDYRKTIVGSREQGAGSVRGSSLRSKSPPVKRAIVKRRGRIRNLDKNIFPFPLFYFLHRSFFRAIPRWHKLRRLTQSIVEISMPGFAVRARECQSQWKSRASYDQKSRGETRETLQIKADIFSQRSTSCLEKGGRRKVAIMSYSRWEEKQFYTITQDSITREKKSPHRRHRQTVICLSLTEKYDEDWRVSLTSFLHLSIRVERVVF